MTSLAVDSRPVSRASVALRVAFLRKVGALTVSGLALSGVTGLATAGVISLFPSLANNLVMPALVFGAYIVAHYVARAVVFHGPHPVVKLGGFCVGAVSQGVAMGYLLLAAMTLSLQQFGNPMIFVLQALGLVGIVTFGMFTYLMTGPRELSMVKGALSMLTLPMLFLMAATFVFPMFFGVGGLIGVGLSAVFVVVSALGLLVQLNEVTHQFPASRWIEGGYVVTMGLLVLFWNVLVLLMKLQRR